MVKLSARLAGMLWTVPNSKHQPTIGELIMKLLPQQRAQYKRALIQAGQTTAGLSDEELQNRFYSTVGKPLNNTTEQKPLPQKTRKVTAKNEDNPKAQLMALFDQLVAGNPDTGMDEQAIAALIDQRLAQTKFITVPLHVLSHALNTLETDSFNCGDEDEHSFLFAQFRLLLNVPPNN